MESPRVLMGRLAVVLLALFAAPLDALERPPSYVVIFCDDLGYGDIGCFGSTKHRTPNIDRIATEGMRLTSFYSTSGVCTPSRSSLLTGCYPRRVNMHQNAAGEWVLFPIARKGLAPAEVTIAEVLRERGYATACIGKWHLGDQRPFLPTRQGFDSYFGIPYSNDMGVRQRRPVENPPLPLMRDEEVIEAPADQTTLTRRYTEEAIAFIRKNRDRPFFLYLPHTFPHWPLHSSERFRGKSANGPFGDTVEEIDWSTGRLLDTLDELDIARTTLVLFTSDNGAASRHGGSNGPLRGHKGSVWEGGMRVPCVVRWPGVVPAGSTCDEVTTTMDLLPTFARLAGAAPPADRVIDGRDIGTLLRGEPGARSPHEAFFYYFRDRLGAVRAGKWKLHLPGVERRRGRDREIGLQLYDLDADIAESRNVAADHPVVVKRLTAFANRCRDELGDTGRQGSGQRPAGIMEDPEPRVMERRGHRVGAAEIDITPSTPIRLRGYASRHSESEGVSQRLWASALAIDGEDGEPAVLISLDNCIVPRALVREIATALEPHGVRPERLAVTATHTHNGPILAGMSATLYVHPLPPDQAARIDRYTGELLAKLVRVSVDALEARAPATLEWGVGTAKFAHNRRTAGGPVDHDLPVLVARGPDGSVRAVSTSYACHCTTLSHNAVSGDWAGWARVAIREAFPGATAVVSAGCGGDQNPARDSKLDREGQERLAERHGREIGAEIERLVVGGLLPIEGGLSARLAWIELPLAQLPTLEEWKRRATPDARAGTSAFHARVQLERLERGEALPTAVPYPVATWTLGDDLAIVFLGGEVVVDYSLRLERELDADRVWINAYSNDVSCYIPSERVLAEGGYEGGGAMIYHDWPAPFAPGLEQRIVDEVLRQLPEAFLSTTR